MLQLVPISLREAAYALGAPRWKVAFSVTLTAARAGVITGILLALARVSGETAPLLVIGALVYVPFIPEGPNDQFTTLPIQIFNWTSRPQAAFLTNAAAAIIILLLITFLLNGIAVYLRHRQQKKIKW